LRASAAPSSSSLGGGAITKEEAAIKFGASGNATLFVLSGASGQGHETVYSRDRGEIFGIDAGNIVLRASDPAGPALAGGGTVGLGRRLRTAPPSAATRAAKW